MRAEWNRMWTMLTAKHDWKKSVERQVLGSGWAKGRCGGGVVGRWGGGVMKKSVERQVSSKFEC